MENQDTLLKTNRPIAYDPTTGKSLNHPYNYSEKPGLVTSTILWFKDMFKVKKRLGRADYWWGNTGVSIINLIVFSILFGALYSIYILPAMNADFLETPEINYNLGYSVWALVVIYFIFIAIASFTAYVRRLHDINRKGNYFWVIFLPFYFGFLTLMILCLQPSVQVDNPWVNVTGNE